MSTLVSGPRDGVALPALESSPRLKTQIAARIRERIAVGALGLGQRLSDKDLASDLRVSRTPVREALLQLQNEGLVIMRPQSGTFVFDVSPPEIEEICQLRGIFETGAVRIGAAAQRAGLVNTLSANVAAARTALRRGDFSRCDALDTDFHESLVAFCGNRLLVETYKTISDKVRALRQRMPRERSRFARALGQHQRIVACIAGGRIATASDELADHVRNVYRLLCPTAAGGTARDD